MAYILEQYKTGKVIETVKRQTIEASRKNAEPRAPKSKPTPDEIAAVNERNAENNLRRLLNANFTEGDFHIVLKYKPGQHPNPAKPADSLRSSCAVCGRNSKRRGGS